MPSIKKSPAMPMLGDTLESLRSAVHALSVCVAEDTAQPCTSISQDELRQVETLRAIIKDAGAQLSALWERVEQAALGGKSVVEPGPLALAIKAVERRSPSWKGEAAEAAGAAAEAATTLRTAAPKAFAKIKSRMTPYVDLLVDGKYDPERYAERVLSRTAASLTRSVQIVETA